MAVCKKLGISQATLNRIEQRIENMALKTLQTMCDPVEMSIDYLFGEAD